MGLAFVITTVSISYSAPKPNHSFKKIINQTFLAIVDTRAYKNHDFFLMVDEPDFYLYRKNWGYNEELLNISEYIKYLPKELIKIHREEYLVLFKKDSIQILPGILKASAIINTGKYKLISNIVCGKLDTTYVGTVRFYQPLISKNYAIIIMSVSSSIKDGKTSAYLLKLLNEKWIKEDEIEFETI